MTLGAAVARAQPEDESALAAQGAPVEIVGGGHAALLSGRQCERELTDVVSCSDAGGLVGGHVAGLYRFAPAWSVGLQAGASVAQATWWQLGALARWHALGAGYPDLWLGGEAGVVLLSESLEADELGSEDTLTHEAPLFGLGVGVDFLVAEPLALGPSLRGLVVPFGNGDWLPDRGTSYWTQVGVELGVSATLLVGN